MSRLTRAIPPAAAVTTALLLTALSVRCSSPQPPHDGELAGRPAVSAPAALPSPDPTVDMTEPDAVCEAFAIALHTAPISGNLQAAASATDELALELAADPGRHPAGSEDGHPGGAAVDTGPYAGHLPPDRDGHSHRAVVLRSGGDAEEPRWIVYCTLQQVGDQWRVAAYEREPRP